MEIEQKRYINHCKSQDLKYIAYLKNQLAYYQKRLLARDLEGKQDMANSLHLIIESMKAEISIREKEFRHDYPTAASKTLLQADGGDIKGSW